MSRILYHTAPRLVGFYLNDCQINAARRRQNRFHVGNFQVTHFHSLTQRIYRMSNCVVMIQQDIRKLSYNFYAAVIYASFTADRCGVPFCDSDQTRVKFKSNIYI